MSNKINFNKYLKKVGLWTIIFVGLTITFTLIEYHIYTRNFNHKIYAILSVVKSEYPKVREDKLMEVLNSEEVSKDLFLEKYGIDLESDSIVEKNDMILGVFVVINGLGIILSSGVLLAFYLRHNKEKDKDIEEIASYVEQINKGNYKLNIDNNSEDELSILKNEVYKTMIMLKEASENSRKDKLSLKNSLSDITHQLKTPLTSIIIALENLEDNLGMDDETRLKFIKNMKSDTNNIRFLIENILKLSKLDTNTVTFNRSNVLIKDIVNGATLNVENLCDLRNIKIQVKGTLEGSIFGDKHWQVEAITNIVKNAVEHADNLVIIEAEDNDLYTKIMVTNDGVGIDKEDLKHIFERFYRGKNATKDSIGIGLALSKKIIEMDNGSIDVESSDGRTVFTVKYFKR